MSVRLAISFPISATRVLSGVSAPDTSLAMRCRSCISIAMSNSFLRSIAVSATSGSATTLSGLVSTVLPSTTSETL